MSNCKFTFDEEKQLWVCSVCGRTVKASKKAIIHADCAEKPPLITQAINYTKAVVKHIATGAETRTDKEVEERLNMCKDCNYYNSEKQFCRLCGCNCNLHKSPFVNKLRMKSQKCPRGKWE